VLEFRGTGTPGADLGDPGTRAKWWIRSWLALMASGCYSLTPEVGAHVYSVRETGSMVESEAVEVSVSEMLWRLAGYQRL
jgi:hypothetical protein